jgi:hypothetical protein
VDAFVPIPRADASAKLVERLLASSAYGRSGAASGSTSSATPTRRAENSDYPVPNAWRYRNYVIEAFNRDLPYDRFLREQIAGDLLAEGAPPERYAELVTATGYLAIARRFGHDIDRDMHLTYEDVIDTMGKSLLGLTLGCARCHNHKYDPVTTRDYYSLYGILASSRFSFPGCEAKQAPRDMVPMTPAALKDWPDERSELEDLMRPRRTTDVAYAVVEGKAADARLQNRGEPDQPGDPVPRRNLEILGGQPVSNPRASGRLDLAAWISDPKNPLTARVMVNRIWQGHFGKGSSRRPTTSAPAAPRPSHPELLDYLASRFIASGWSVKAMQRLILSSAAYRAARFPRRRLDAEEIRDSLLAASLELDRSPGRGHPLSAREPVEVHAAQPLQGRLRLEAPQRLPHDPADPAAPVPGALRRPRHERQHRAARHQHGADPGALLPERSVLPRPVGGVREASPRAPRRGRGRGRAPDLLPARAAGIPNSAGARAFLEACRAELGAGAELAVWSAYARTLLGSNEFLYLD